MRSHSAPAKSFARLRAHRRGGHPVLQTCEKQVEVVFILYGTRTKGGDVQVQSLGSCTSPWYSTKLEHWNCQNWEVQLLRDTLVVFIGTSPAPAASKKKAGPSPPCSGSALMGLDGP